MKILYLFCLIAIFSTLNAVQLAFAQVPKVAIDGWKEMQKMTDVVNFHLDFTVAGAPSYTSFLAKQGPLFKLEISQKNSEMAYLYDTLSFVLEKEKSRWQLGNVLESKEASIRMQDMLYNVNIGYSPDARGTLLQLVKNRKFRFANWSELPSSNLYSFELYEEDGKNPWRRIFLDGSKRFRISRIEYPEAHVEIIYDYNDNSSVGQVIPERVTQEAHKFVWRFSELSSIPLPESAFKLSHYGLPDYTGSNRSRSFLVWLVLAALVGLALMVAKNRKWL